MKGGDAVLVITVGRHGVTLTTNGLYEGDDVALAAWLKRDALADVRRLVAEVGRLAAELTGAGTERPS